MLNDTINTRLLQNDTTYIEIDKRSKAPFNSQYEFSVYAKEAVAKLEALDESKPYTPIRRADLEKNEIKKVSTMKRIGILTSGGDCQGLNAAIRGVGKTFCELLGDKVKNLWHSRRL